MTDDPLMRARGYIAYGLAAIYFGAAVLGLFADFETTSGVVTWVAVLCGGGAFILAGVFVARASGWLAAILITVGAVGGGIPLFWTIVVPLGVAVVVAMSFVIARRTAATPA